MNFWSITCLICILNGATYAANILGIFPIPSPSHLIVMSSLTKELASRGHNVTVISFYPQEKKLPNYNEIVISMDTEGTRPKFNRFVMFEENSYKKLIRLWNTMTGIVENVFEHDSIKNFIKNKDTKFDLVIVEAFFNEAFLGFGEYFNAPIITISPFGGFHWVASSVGSPWPPSYVPDTFSSYTDHMTFSERFSNFAIWLFTTIGRNFYYLPMQDKIMKKHLNVKTSVKEAETSTSLVLANNHISLTYPRPLSPNFIQVGGIHIKSPKPLEKDLKEYLDSASDGVIYFSMGSNLRSTDMPETTRNALLEAFGRLSQKVIWKWEEDSLPGQPKNVKLGKWLPQLDILAHPNVKLFITHGGLLSTMEAITHAIPLIGIPIFGDQELNVKLAEKSGYAKKLAFDNITAASVEWTIKEVLENPSYKEKAKILSKLFHDRPMTAIETAVYWTEYVLRHKGAKHLRSAGLDLSWCQYLLLDVLAVVFIVSLSPFVILWAVCCRKKHKGTIVEKRKKKQ